MLVFWTNLRRKKFIFYAKISTFFDLYTHPELVSESRRFIKGFTLIELLVVVLIIGILAAVAVPQYQKAVYKSHYAKIKSLVTSIAQAQEVYYLANGHYSSKFDELDIDMPSGKLDTSTDNRYFYDWGECYIDNGDAAQVGCNHSKIKMGYQHRQAHSVTQPNIRICQSLAIEETDIRNQICKSETKAVSGVVLNKWNTTSWTYQ